MRWVLVFLVLLAAVAGAGYAALPWILQTVIVQQAANRGVAVSELQVQRPTWGVAVVDRIALSVDANELQAEEVVVRFTWDSLLNGRAIDITVSRLILAARIDGAAAAPPSAAEESADLQSADVGQLLTSVPELLTSNWELVPAETLSINEARVEVADVEFSGTLALSQTVASLQGRVMAPQPVPALDVSARLTAGGELRVDLREVGGSSDGRGKSNTLKLEADLGTTRGGLAASWAARLAAPEGPISIDVEGSVPFVLSEAGWQLASGLTVSVASSAWQGAMEVTAAAGSWQSAADELARVAGQWRGSTQLAATDFRANGELSAVIGRAVIQVTLDAGTAVSAGRVAGEDWSLDGAVIELSQPVSLDVELQPLAYRLRSAARLAIPLERIVWSDYAISPFVDLTLQTLSGDLERVESTARVQIAGLQMSADVRVSGPLPAGPFVIELDTEQQITGPFLAGLLPELSQPYDLQAGSVNARGALRLGGAELDELTGAVTLTLADLDAHYEDITVSGINGELTVDLDAGAWQVGPNRIEVALTDVGFPVSDIAALVELSPESLVVSELTGRALAGQVEVGTLVYDIAAGDSEFLVSAVGVQLAEVLALEGDTVTGSATLDGQLPVQVVASEVRVSGGRFSAREPGGVLSYAGAEEAAASLGQPGVSFAIAALGDFRFAVLDVEVTYEPNGDLLLGVHMEGRNPSFEGGRPIHYNLNISENIPVLLQSLQLSDEVGKQLEKRLVQ